MRWSELLTNELLIECGKGCSTLPELVDALCNKTKHDGSYDSLWSSHRRHKKRLNLKDSLLGYLGKSPPARSRKPKGPKLSDLKFPLSPERTERINSADRFVITAALNNTPVDQACWETLKQYAKRNNAELIVIPIRYKNPTSRVEGKLIDMGAWWPEEVIPYLTDDRITVHEHFWIMGEVRIQATATKPLTGLGTLTKGASGAFGHSQLSMEMIPTPQNKLPKVLYTTGCVSVADYSDSKAGVKSLDSHSMGGLILELNGPRFHVRELITDDQGGCYDLDRYYHPKGSRKSTGALALITGDEHALFNDPACRVGTYTGKNSITKVCKPKTLVRHDVFDGYSISHHNRKDPAIQIANHKSGFHKVEDELMLTRNYIDNTTPRGVKNLIVSSNHHDHLLQWMKETTPLDEPWNANIWLKLWSAFEESIVMGEGGPEYNNPLETYLLPLLRSETEFLSGRCGRTIADIVIDMHGHRGANGSRGSINQFTKFGVKSIIGHSHTPGRQKDCVQVGTSSLLRLSYTNGPSSWAHCHCLIHPNGTRQIIFLIDGVWRL